MSDETVAITVQILGKEYRVACPEDEREDLMASAALLNSRMEQIRDSGKVVGSDRIAVIAALNITHELLQNQSERETLSHSVTDRIRLLQNRIEQALEHGQQMEL
ncbi:MAG: cell division protein ZapA [Thiohalocapsa sp.]|jgi:cell division protein ZapA